MKLFPLILTRRAGLRGDLPLFGGAAAVETRVWYERFGDEPGSEQDQLRVRGFSNSAAGLPTSALADEILLESESRIRALITIGGNPMRAWPDPLRTQRALEKLDLGKLLNAAPRAKQLEVDDIRYDFAANTKVAEDLLQETGGHHQLRRPRQRGFYPARRTRKVLARLAAAVVDDHRRAPQ